MEFSPEIIRRIEAEVAKVLKQQGIALTSAQSDKRILAIFDAVEVGLARPLEQLDRCIQRGYVVTAILSDIAAKILDISRIRSACGQERVFIASEITNLQPFTGGFSTNCHSDAIVCDGSEVKFGHGRYAVRLPCVPGVASGEKSSSNV